MKTARLLLACTLATPALLACSGADDTAPASDPNPFYGAGGLGGANGGTFTGNGGTFAGNGGTFAGNGGTFAGSGGTFAGNGGTFAGSGGTFVGNGGALPAGGTAGTGAGGLGAGGAAPTAKPKCITAPTQVVVVGDSYVTGFASPALVPSIAKLNPQASQWRNYAVAGTSMVSGGVLGLPRVPMQWDQAVAAGADIRLSVMDGGGNDILICDQTAHPQCSTLCAKAGSASQKVCTDIVTAAIQGATDLMNKAAGQGVRDVVYFFYPHIPSMNGGYSEILDYAQPKAKAACDGASAATGGKLRCYFVATTEAFKAAGGDKNPANFAGDGIHPSAAGQDIIAKLIDDTMKANHLGEAPGANCE